MTRPLALGAAWAPPNMKIPFLMNPRPPVWFGVTILPPTPSPVSSGVTTCPKEFYRMCKIFSGYFLNDLPQSGKTNLSLDSQLPPSAQMVHIFLALQEVRSFMATLPRPDEWWRITASFEVHFCKLDASSLTDNKRDIEERQDLYKGCVCTSHSEGLPIRYNCRLCGGAS